MAKTPITIAKTIALALNNMYQTHIVINTTNFYGDAGKLVRMYTIKDAYSFAGNYSNKELFCTASGVYTCLFMVDLLASFRGEELEDHQNPGYTNVFMKKNGLAAIEYMKGVYLDEFSAEG